MLDDADNICGVGGDAAAQPALQLLPGSLKPGGQACQQEGQQHAQQNVDGGVAGPAEHRVARLWCEQQRQQRVGQARGGGEAAAADASCHVCPKEAVQANLIKPQQRCLYACMHHILASS